MNVRILKRAFDGTEFASEARVLRFGGKGSAKVEKLVFELPEEWEGKTVTLHVQHMDGTMPVPILLDEENSVEIDKSITATTKGLWMLQAVDGEGYCALTKPGKYECYETIAADGDEEISPSMYEAFVAQVAESASRAQTAARTAEGYASDAGQSARDAEAAQQTAWEKAEDAAKSAQAADEGAEKAERAAKRAESYAPEDGTVLSVNGKGGAVWLSAEDVEAVPKESDGYVQKIELVGAMLTLTLGDGSVRSYQTQDTVALESMSGVLAVEHGGTGKQEALSAGDVGAVALDSSGYVKSVREESGVLKVVLGDGSEVSVTLASAYTLPKATSYVLGGVKIGANLTIAADGTLRLTLDNVAAALGYTSSELSQKLSKIDGIAYPDGKVVYSGSGTAHYTSYSNKSGFSKSLPDSVDYVKVTTSVRDDEDGSITAECKVARGGSGSLQAYNLGGTSTKYYLTITFSSSGTLTVGTPPTVGMNNVCNITGYSY